MPRRGRCHMGWRARCRKPARRGDVRRERRAKRWNGAASGPRRSPQRRHGFHLDWQSGTIRPSLRPAARRHAAAGRPKPRREQRGAPIAGRRSPGARNPGERAHRHRLRHRRGGDGRSRADAAEAAAARRLHPRRRAARPVRARGDLHLRREHHHARRDGRPDAAVLHRHGAVAEGVRGDAEAGGADRRRPAPGGDGDRLRADGDLERDAAGGDHPRLHHRAVVAPSWR